MRKLILLFVFVGSLAGPWNAQADTAYLYPDIQRCMFPQPNAPCVASTLAAGIPVEQDYPVFDPNTGKSYQGCYDRKFHRQADLPATGPCDVIKWPIRVQVKYFKQCLNGQPTCTSDARVVVRPKITADSPDLATLRLTGSRADGVTGGFDPIILDPTTTGDAAFGACAAVKDMGYSWDPATRTCGVDPARQCQRLGFIWEGNRCLNKCDVGICTKKMCSGAMYVPDGQTCTCLGTSRTTDDNGAPCAEVTATPTPNSACSASLVFVNSVPGQTVSASIPVDSVAQAASIGGRRSRTLYIDCSKTVGTLSLVFSSALPPMCVLYNSTSGGCGFSNALAPGTFLLPNFTDGMTQYVYTYAQGGNPDPAPAATPAPSVSVSAVASPTVALQDLVMTSLNVTYLGGATATSIQSGVTQATVSVKITNNGTVAASGRLFFAGPISGCATPTEFSVPVTDGSAVANVTIAPGATYTVPGVTCTLSGAPGKACARAYVQYVDGEDSNAANNTAGAEMQICPNCGVPITTGVGACQ